MSHLCPLSNGWSAPGSGEASLRAHKQPRPPATCPDRRRMARRSPGTLVDKPQVPRAVGRGLKSSRPPPSGCPAPTVRDDAEAAGGQQDEARRLGGGLEEPADLAAGEVGRVDIQVSLAGPNAREQRRLGAGRRSTVGGD